MNKRKRHAIKKEKLKDAIFKKAKKEKLIGSIVLTFIIIAGCIANFFIGKAINDGNMFFILFPLLLRATIVAAFMIIAIMVAIKSKMR